MEKSSDCEMCNSSIISVRFDCNHVICAKCIHIPILSNLQELNLKDIDENVTYECIICQKGNTSINNNYLSHFIRSCSNNNIEVPKESQKCVKHNSIFKFFCKTCNNKLCALCSDEQNNEHEITTLKYFEKDSVNLCFEHKEKFKMFCKTCNRIICNSCCIDSHSNHSTSNADDHFKSVKNELKLIRMPYNINTIHDFIKKFNEEVNNFLTLIKNDQAYTKNKISELIMYLNEVNNSIELNFDKLENDFKFNCQFIKQIFTSYYHNIQTIEESDYPKLHHLNKLPKSFLDFTFNSNINRQTFDTSFNTIKNNISKLKDDSNLILYTINDNTNMSAFRHWKGILIMYGALIQLKNGMIASGSDDKTIKIWDPNQNHKCIQTFEGHTDTVCCLIQLQNGMIASGSGDATIKIWDPNQNHKCIQTLEEHTDSVGSLIQLQNGMIASGSADKTIIIWYPNQNHKCIQRLEGHISSVWWLIELQNGMIASVSSDKTIKIWDPNQNHKCIQSLEGHNNYVLSLIQLQYGMIASGSGDKTIKIWDQLIKKLIR